MSFSEMLGVLGVSSSFLTYHLENLGELVGKIDDNKYRLSSFGQAAMATMTKVEDIPTAALQQFPETKPKKMVSRTGALNRLFVYAIIINVALLVVFILLDFLTWNAVAVNLNSRMQTILTPAGIYTAKVTGIYSNYGLVWVGINVRYVIPNIFLMPQDSVGISINLPLI